MRTRVLSDVNHDEVSVEPPARRRRTGGRQPASSATQSLPAMPAEGGARRRNVTPGQRPEINTLLDRVQDRACTDHDDAAPPIVRPKDC